MTSSRAGWLAVALLPPGADAPPRASRPEPVAVTTVRSAR
jgi:hypothetical protein